MVCILISTALFSSFVLFVVAVAACLLVYGGFYGGFSLFVFSLRRDLNKNSSNPCSYLKPAAHESYLLS